MRCRRGFRDHAFPVKARSSSGREVPTVFMMWHSSTAPAQASYRASCHLRPGQSASTCPTRPNTAARSPSAYDFINGQILRTSARVSIHGPNGVRGACRVRTVRSVAALCATRGIPTSRDCRSGQMSIKSGASASASRSSAHLPGARGENGLSAETRRRLPHALSGTGTPSRTVTIPTCHGSFGHPETVPVVSKSIATQVTWRLLQVRP